MRSKLTTKKPEKSVEVAPVFQFVSFVILNIFWNIFEYTINVIANFEQALFGKFWLTLNNCLSTIIKPFSKN